MYLGNGDFGFGEWIGNSINDIGYALDFYGSFSYYGFMDEYVMTAVDYVIPPEPEAGDVDGDEVITADDAVYIIYNLTFGSREYPLNQSCDYDGDGSVTPKDAAYLLYHIFFGEEEFPLHTAA